MTTTARATTSIFAALRRPEFCILFWTGNIASVGYWMQDLAGSWLMTSLAPSPLMVSLMQTATYLPYFLLSLPAGALADVIDRRLQVFTSGIWLFIAVIGLGLLTISGLMTPWLLLSMIVIAGIGNSFQSPAWNALPPELVPHKELDSAVALGGVGWNCARGIGAALGGILVASFGPGWVFILNALSMVAMLFAVYKWKRAPAPPDQAPTERWGSAVKAGVRYVRHSHALRVVLVRTGIFVICGSCIWALLPLLARQSYGMSSIQYGIALSIFGLGTLIGAAIMPRLREVMNLDWLCVVGTVMYGASMVLLAAMHDFASACVALFSAGMGWLIVSSAVNTSLLKAAPAWVRARAVAVYLLVFQGCLAFGSLLWGCIASAVGMPLALLYGAAGLLTGLFAMLRYSLEAVENLDMRTSGQWPAPQVMVEPHPDHGPVQITIEYQIEPETIETFVKAISALEVQRRRNGAYQWHLFLDLTRPGTYIESYFVETWAEHLRLRNRVTNDDLSAEERAYSLHSGECPPKMTHLLAERRRNVNGQSQSQSAKLAPVPDIAQGANEGIAKA